MCLLKTTRYSRVMFEAGGSGGCAGLMFRLTDNDNYNQLLLCYGPDLPHYEGTCIVSKVMLVAKYSYFVGFVFYYLAHFRLSSSQARP